MNRKTVLGIMAALILFTCSIGLFNIPAVGFSEEWITVTSPAVEMSIENKTTPLGEELSILMVAPIGAPFLPDTQVFDVYLYDSNYSLFSYWSWDKAFLQVIWWVPPGYNETLKWNLYSIDPYMPPPPGDYYLVGAIMPGPADFTPPILIRIDKHTITPVAVPTEPDVAVTSIGFHHSTVHGNITVTTQTDWGANLIYVDAEISNNGEAPETVETTFTYTIANVSTTIGVVFVDVANGSTEIASVSLDTKGFPLGYLPIKVEATTVYYEENTLDNNMTTTLLIKLAGDCRGDSSGSPPDGDVDWYDFGEFAAAYGSHYGQPGYNVECDSDRDGDVDWFDFGIFAQNYGKTAV